MAPMDTALTAATSGLKTTLTLAAASGELGRVAGDALGILSVPESFWELQQAWAEGQFSNLPGISLSPGSSMDKARGAYVVETDTILLNQDWLAQASDSEVLAVLVEEVGQSLDTRFNSVDTWGDEGGIFSRFLVSQMPSSSERARITSENDAIQVTLANGQQSSAEAADALEPVVTTTDTNQADQPGSASNSNALVIPNGKDDVAGGIDGDRMEGGSGDQTYLADFEGVRTANLGDSGPDWVLSTDSYTLVDITVSPESYTNNRLDLRGTANLVGTGNGEDNIIKGNGGSSTLIGGAGNDSLYGRGSGTDILFGDEGNDYLDGGLGTDLMVGGSGNDWFVVDNIRDLVIEAENDGFDSVISDISYNLADNLGDNLEGLNLRGLTGGEDLNGSGNDLNNTIYGNEGRNILNGDKGNDILSGGAGSDTVFGGEGSDLFMIANKELDGSIAMDTIGDFQTGSDIVSLSRAALNLDPSRFGSGLINAADFKIVNSTTEGGLQGENGLASTSAFVFDQSMGILYHNSNGAELGAGENPNGILDFLKAELNASDIQLL